ncbi:hypothetical protein [Psychroflexus sp. S27]|uniref:hypothetical protein n=1 Tax=Psychroflexus sp. S27 TaxID=1982757 RepID=UPI001864805F|nr:hypothetical protein [Psychroflexus sp. S27]
MKFVDLDLNKFTLSFLSNKDLYGDSFVKGYKWLLFVTAFLTYFFFLLLTSFYDLRGYNQLMQYIDFGCLSLASLAFVPHNIRPFSKEAVKTNMQRILHNLLAVIVFLSLPGLILTFQLIVLADFKVLGVVGTIIIGLMMIFVALSIIKNGINGITELIFINGISLWTIFVTIMTVLG